MEHPVVGDGQLLDEDCRRVGLEYLDCGVLGPVTIQLEMARRVCPVATNVPFAASAVLMMAPCLSPFMSLLLRGYGVNW